jgi:predicted dehydrogenase
MDRTRIAFLGGSHSHAFDKVKVVMENPRWELLGVSEDDPEFRSPYEKAGVPLVSRDQVLNDSSIQVIAVESEVRDHNRDGEAALAAGKHVHLEKPPADRLAVFRSMVDAAQRKHLLLQMGYMWRYNPALNAALEAGRKGWLGEIYLVRGTMNTLVAPRARAEWARFRGGQMFEQGSHIIDLTARLLGRPEKVTPFLRSHGRFDDKLMDNTIAVLEYPRALAIITAAVLQPNAWPHRFFEILGTNGTAVVRPIEPPALAIDLVKAAGPYQQGMQTVPLRPYRRFVDDFAELEEAVRLRKPLTVTPAEDLLVQETVMQACEM